MNKHDFNVEDLEYHGNEFTTQEELEYSKSQEYLNQRALPVFNEIKLVVEELLGSNKDQFYYKNWKNIQKYFKYTYLGDRVLKSLSFVGRYCRADKTIVSSDDPFVEAFIKHAEVGNLAFKVYCAYRDENTVQSLLHSIPELNQFVDRVRKECGGY